MTSRSDEADLLGAKCMFHALIELVVKSAQERGIAREKIYRMLAAESLVMAAELHDGSDASFLNMAKRSLALARTGNIEQ